MNMNNYIVGSVSSWDIPFQDFPGNLGEIDKFLIGLKIECHLSWKIQGFFQDFKEFQLPLSQDYKKSGKY